MSLPKTMKAIRVIKSGASTPSLELQDVPVPSPKEGEVLIKIAASSVQPSDILNSQGSFPHTTYPRTLGRDFAGTVVAGPAEWQGKKVFGTSGTDFSFTQDGAHAEYAIVAISGLVHMPSQLSFAEAATIGVVWSAAAMTLSRAGIKSGDTVMVLGATGGVGDAAMQIARSKGCTAIGVGRHNTDVNSVTDPLLSTAKELTGGVGPYIVIDTVGDLSLTRAAIDIMADDGRLSTITAPRTGDTHLSLDIFTFYRKSHHLIGCNTAAEPQASLTQLLGDLVPAFAAGKLKVKEVAASSEIPIDKWEDAYSGKLKKAVLTFT